MEESYNICMIATGADQALLDRMIRSVDAGMGNLKVLIVLVKQGDPMILPTDAKVDIKYLHHEQLIGLSKARNLGLKKWHELDCEVQHIMFPDDDSSFPPAFFEAYQSVCKSGKAYLGRVCNEEDGKNYKSYPRQKSISGSLDLLPYVASVSMILPQKLVLDTGGFDEKLGAGAEFGSSEDLDYYIRCSKQTSFEYHTDLVSLHPGRFRKYSKLNPAQLKTRFRAYTDGYLYVMFRYGLQKRARLLGVRAIAGATISLMRFDFRLAVLYIWLSSYRQKKYAYFKRMMQMQPEYFEGKICSI